MEHHISYIGRFPVSQFNDNLGEVDLKCTWWVHFRWTPPKLYFPKIMEFSHYVEYGVMGSQVPIMSTNLNMKAKSQLLSLKKPLKYDLYLSTSNLDYFLQNIS